MNTISKSTTALALASLMMSGLITIQSAQAQSFNLLHSFCSKADCPDGAGPVAALIQATDGNLYGTTGSGDDIGCGSVFRITTGGTLTTLASFDCSNGRNPDSALIQGLNGALYGTAAWGGNQNCPGKFGCGTIFRITRGDKLAALHLFDGTDGQFPVSSLIQAANGDFYGTTSAGGATGQGTVFKMATGGTLNTLYSFCSLSNCTDGANPNAALTEDANGVYYGTTANGGLNCISAGGCGTVFKITAKGTLTTLHSFCAQVNSNGYCTDGDYVLSGLVQGTDGNFYGTTPTGGANGQGTVFKITPGGELTTLYNFCSASHCEDGAGPETLIQGTDGNFYGTTSNGGNDDVGASGGYGTVFKITPGGTLTTLHYFDEWDGAEPSGLTQHTDGDFYGTAIGGGAYGFGTVFSLSVDLGPFVETQTSSGKVGATVIILGTNLTGVIAVLFNGISTAFTAVSESEILATVPSGATTGPVQVLLVNPPTGGLLTSNKSFTVIP